MPLSKSISFAPTSELFPFDPIVAPSCRLDGQDDTPPLKIDTETPPPLTDDHSLSDPLLPVNQNLLSSVRRAADESSLPPSILSLRKQPSTIDPSLPGHATPNITTNTSGKPLERNLLRLQNSLVENQAIIGKSISSSFPPYLSNSIEDHFPSPITIPPLPPPSHPLNIDTILSVFHSTVPTPKASPFIHERSVAAAAANSVLIAKYDHDLQALFDAHPGTTISPGSEFRPPSILKPLLFGHPFWPKIEHDLTFGATYQFRDDLPGDDARVAENEALIAYGNHSSARKRPAALIKVSQKDTVHGWAFPLTFDCARKIKGGRFAPLGVAQHNGITERGEIIVKDRLAHDQTFSTGLAPSLNLAVDDSDDIDLVYGWCLERLIHQIVALRLEFPRTRILVCKFDWGAAYRRINGDGLLAANALTTDASGEFANILSRLSFGGKTHPAMFSLFSETACDLCNDLIEFKEWNPSICYSPLQKLMGPPNRLPEDIPFEQGKPLIVDIPARPDGSVDVYLDDMVQLFADEEDIVSRTSAVVPLVLHLFIRPCQPDKEPIKRTDILAEDKMMAEGSPSEVMRVLGWELDTRRLLLILPIDKYLNWSKAVRHLADPKTRKTKFRDLETTVGKLIHSSKGIPLARFFLQRTRTYMENLIKQFDDKQRSAADESDDDDDQSSISSSGTVGSDGDQTVPQRSSDARFRPKPWFRYAVPEYVKEDMTVWIDLLERAHQGVNLNLLTCRRPTNILLADACPLGMGGYSIKSGIAWQVPLDPSVYEMAGHADDLDIDPTLSSTTDLKLSNNLFEYIAQVVTIWLEQHHGDIEDLGVGSHLGSLWAFTANLRLLLPN